MILCFFMISFLKVLKRFYSNSSDNKCLYDSFSINCLFQQENEIKWYGVWGLYLGSNLICVIWVHRSGAILSPHLLWRRRRKGVCQKMSLPVEDTRRMIRTHTTAWAAPPLAILFPHPIGVREGCTVQYFNIPYLVKRDKRDESGRDEWSGNKRSPHPTPRGGQRSLSTDLRQ